MKMTKLPHSRPGSTPPKTSSISPSMASRLAHRRQQPGRLEQAGGPSRQGGVGRVGIEATGGYERGVTRHLQAAGFTVIVLQPLQVKAFAKLHLRRAKNDRLDAALIAACTYCSMRRTGWRPIRGFDALADHLTFIEQIEEDIARCNTRLEHIADQRLRRLVDRRHRRGCRSAAPPS